LGEQLVLVAEPLDAAAGHILLRHLQRRLQPSYLRPRLCQRLAIAAAAAAAWAGAR